MKKFYYLIAMAMMAFTFTSCEDVPEPFGQPINPNKGTQETIDPAGSGTKADPYNITAIIDFTKALGADIPSTEDVYFKGIVTEITTEYVADNYGNATFYVSDKADAPNKFLCYRTLYLGNNKFTEGKTQIKTGDEVIICGKVTNYKGNTPETVSNGAYLYSLNGVTDGGGDTPKPSGDVKTVSVADFIKASVSTTDWYQLTGTIKNLKDGDQYGNFDIEDATGSVYVYGLLSEKGGEKKKFQELVTAKGIANGKKITIIGNRGEYNSAIQVTNAYFVKIEDGEGGGGTPTPSGEGDGSEAKPFNVAAAIAAGSGTGVFVKAYIVGWVEGQTLASGAHFDANATVATNILIATSADETDVNKCMPVQLPSGAVRTAVNLQNNASNYKKEIILVANIEKYFGVTGLKSTSYAKIGSTEAGTKPGGGESGGGQTGSNHGTAEAPLTVAQAIALIDAESTISDAYVKGKISQIDNYNSTYKSITYWISDDGTTATQLQVYSGKGLNGADFAAKEDLTVGKEVVIKGNLKKYNTTYEFDKTSSIISIQ